MDWRRIWPVEHRDCSGCHFRLLLLLWIIVVAASAAAAAVVVHWIMLSKKNYRMVANNEFDVRIPLHADEAFQNGIIFQAKVIHSSIYTQTHTHAIITHQFSWKPMLKFSCDCMALALELIGNGNVAVTGALIWTIILRWVSLRFDIDLIVSNQLHTKKDFLNGILVTFLIHWLDLFWSETKTLPEAEEDKTNKTWGIFLITADWRW